MPLRTTCIGAFPKPDYVPVRDWFQIDLGAGNYAAEVVGGWEAGMRDTTLLDRATREVVADQLACGIDLPTDGEVRRENYVHYQCRHMTGFDFAHLTRRVLRNGAYDTMLPSITGRIGAGDAGPLVRDWQVAEAAAGRPVRMTLPGPLTISDTCADIHYNDPARLAADLGAALNVQVHALAQAGCRHIQIDEPVFARQPDAALAYGLDALARVFHGLPEGIERAVHICCGYSSCLDDHDYPKADPTAYLALAEPLDGLVDAVSIEDAHRHNPTDLFARFQRARLIVGFVAIASSRIEPVEEISVRMTAVLDHLPPDRLIAAPDCGLGYLGRALAMAKLRNLVAAARLV